MFAVEAIDPVILTGSEALEGTQQMSPYVWKRPAGGYSMVVRIVPPVDSADAVTGRIWYGECDGDGLRFAMDREPLIAPGPGPLDCRGCEDPTVVPVASGCVVYYTGLDANGDACLLYAEGPDIRRLAKRGVAHVATATERHTKEATVERRAGGDWRLFFEYSRGNRSRVGVATCGGPEGPWQDHPDPFRARPHAWDSWHLSTGPLLRGETLKGKHVMFYNGSDRYPRWNIGWIVIDDETLREVARCEAPLIAADENPGGKREIAFAASLVGNGERLWLYFTRDDRTLFRATIAWAGDRAISENRRKNG